MPSLVARVLMSLGVILSAPVLWLLIVIGGHELLSWRNEEVSFLVASVVCAIIFTGAWTAMWFTTVRWTPIRIIATAFLWCAAVVMAMVVGLTFAIGGNEEETGIIMGSMVWFVAWFTLSPLVWMELPSERRKRHGLALGGGDAAVGGSAASTAPLPCPKCGYDMTGLREARCPECGQQYQLQELVAELITQRDRNQVLSQG